jgi:hypothetical protein
LSSNKVGASYGHMVHWRERGSNASRLINSPQAQQDYIKYFNAVDRNDRDSADYSTSIRTNCYYLWIFCWILNRVNHVLYMVVCYLANSGIRESKWSRYLKKEFGRHDFQINLCMSLLTRAIEWDWDGKSKKPGWMRQYPVLPCNCNQCFFCLNGITSGITHHRTKKQKVTVDYKCGTRVKTDKCTSKQVNLRLKAARYCRMCY